MYNPVMPLRVLVCLLAALAVGGCASRDVQKDLTLVDVRTGWYDAGVLEDGKNKLVPSVSLKIQNVSAEDIASVEMNAIFRRVGEPEVWGEHFIRASGQTASWPDKRVRQSCSDRHSATPGRSREPKCCRTANSSMRAS
jgi:hypothetical protein